MKGSTMQEILDEMVAHIDSDDIEESHMGADSLLVDLIRLLAEGLPEQQTTLVEPIIESYRKVDKWFA